MQASSSMMVELYYWVTPLATGVLTFFAGVQIWQVRKESKDRQRAAFVPTRVRKFVAVATRPSGKTPVDLMTHWSPFRAQSASP